MNELRIEKVEINKIQQFTGFKRVEIGGINITSEKCIIYDNCGIAIYHKDERIIFIECKNFEVTRLGDIHITIKYNSKTGVLSQKHLYLIYKEKDKKNNYVKDILKIGDKIIRQDNKDHVVGKSQEKCSDCSLIFQVYLHDKDKVLNVMEHVRADFEWIILEIIDNIIAKIEKDGVEELCLLDEMETLDSLLHNAEEVRKSLNK